MAVSFAAKNSSADVRRRKNAVGKQQQALLGSLEDIKAGKDESAINLLEVLQALIKFTWILSVLKSYIY